MSIREHFKINNPHHAYLIEGKREEVFPEIVSVVESWGVKISDNPDFCHISTDTFKIEDARNLKSLTSERGITKSKKIFVISANNFLLEAQNAMLKVFEEPADDVLFFIITPDIAALLKTLVSRFYLIKTNKEDMGNEAEKFIALPVNKRIDFIKKLINETEDNLNSTRSKSLKFLNALETTLHQKKVSRVTLDTFEQIFKAREYLRQPGSSAKNLLESVALML